MLMRKLSGHTTIPHSIIFTYTAGLCCR